MSFIYKTKEELLNAKFKEAPAAAAEAASAGTKELKSTFIEGIDARVAAAEAVTLRGAKGLHLQRGAQKATSWPSCSDYIKYLQENRRTTQEVQRSYAQ